MWMERGCQQINRQCRDWRQKVSWEDIGPEQYCEYRVRPSREWQACLFSRAAVEELQRTQLVSRLQKWRQDTAFALCFLCFRVYKTVPFLADCSGTS